MKHNTPLDQHTRSRSRLRRLYARERTLLIGITHAEEEHPKLERADPRDRRRGEGAQLVLAVPRLERAERVELPERAEEREERPKDREPRPRAAVGVVRRRTNAHAHAAFGVGSVGAQDGGLADGGHRGVVAEREVCAAGVLLERRLVLFDVGHRSEGLTGDAGGH